jgi:hypothetical protein
MLPSCFARLEFKVYKCLEFKACKRQPFLNKLYTVCHGGAHTTPIVVSSTPLEKSGTTLKICLTIHFLLFEQRLVELLLLTRVDFLKRFN